MAGSREYPALYLERHNQEGRVLVVEWDEWGVTERIRIPMHRIHHMLQVQREDER